MKRTDAYQLANLALPVRVIASLALLSGLGLFWSGWVVSVFFVDWKVSVLGLLNWGERLMSLGVAPLRMLLAGHVASLVLLFAVALALFRRAPLPRLTRRALFSLAVALAFTDIACWLLAPMSDVASAMLGSVVTLLGALLTYFVAAPLHAMWARRSWEPKEDGPVRVVVVGGGFAGLYAALGLDKALGYHPKLELTVIDRKNYFLFPPLLPSVAAGAIETRQVTYPFRRLFEATNIRFKKETVMAIDCERRIVRSRVDVAEDMSSGALVARHDETNFDYLVLAPGSTTNSFRTEGIEHAFFMRELSDAIALRNHVIDCFETAARERDPALVAEMLRFVIVGAGPTGVEVASEIRDLVDQVLLGRYPEIDRALVEVIVVDPGERILNGWDARVANDASTQLEKLGVLIRRGARVARLGADWVAFNDGTRIETRTCVWCAGVSAPELLRSCGLVLNKSGRAEIGTDCRAAGHERIFVLGDAAHFPTADGRGLPPLGQVAFQQGAHTARNLVRLLRGEHPTPFRYFDFGQLVSVGHHFAAMKLLGVRLRGFVAWFVWRTLYLGKLVGFGNKLRVVLDWTLDLFIERSISELHTERHRHERTAPALQSRPQRASI